MYTVIIRICTINEHSMKIKQVNLLDDLPGLRCILTCSVQRTLYRTRDTKIFTVMPE